MLSCLNYKGVIGALFAWCDDTKLAEEYRLRVCSAQGTLACS